MAAVDRVAFISHSSTDKQFGEEVCRFLEANDIACWIAPRDVMPGKNYGAAILEAIAECEIFILLLSSSSNKSGQVVREVERAASSNSIIIPVRIEDVHPSHDLEFYVSAAHWLDALTPPLEKHLQSLLRAIQSWQKGEQPARTEPDRIAIHHAAPAAPKTISRTPLIIAACAIAAAVVVGLFLYRMKPLATTTSRPAEAPAPAATGPPVSNTGWEITGSSQHDNHAAAMAFDGNANTSWVTDTDGIGQTLKVNFKAPVSLTSVSIVSGNAKDPEHYQANNRPWTMRLKWADGTTQVISLDDKMGAQHFALQHRAPTDSITFEILSIYPGSRNNWAAISEIAFNRDASDAATDR